MEDLFLPIFNPDGVRKLYRCKMYFPIGIDIGRKVLVSNDFNPDGLENDSEVN